jgi:hypothetical protein
MSRRWEVWAMYETPVRMSRHWTRRGAESARLRWMNSLYGLAWLPHEVRRADR